MSAAEKSNISASVMSTRDCQPCRYVGTGLFLGIAGYIWYNTRGTLYSASIYKRLPLHLAAAGSLYMSLARYIYLPPFRHLAPKQSYTS